jgi:quinol monooxygenase YgiN
MWSVERTGGSVVVIQVSVKAKSESVDRFEQVLREVVGQARGEPGCCRYEWYRSPDAEREVFIYGEFESEDVFAEYRKGPVVKRIGQELIPLLESRPSFKHFRATVLEQA